ncbi:Zn(2)-C6 fungal-type transcription factor afumD-like protein [Cladobotryum mycophilum]|uniref:Zn(2)-C6 fungal-type transcription factor afumD-like protein n=1 Tax=Cladobotryum mycophilum TaxID=491253 RepID=A0ABR0SWS8_9HYPO
MQIQSRVRKCPRLSHKKSKTGCQQCRGRRVKCDEVHPVCGPCGRHNVKCYYDRPCIIQGDHLPKEGRKRRLMEINLVHHYIVETCQTFPTSLQEQFSTWPDNIWDSHVIRLAMDYEPLLYMIMAITILHAEATGSKDLYLMDDALKLRRGYIAAMENQHLTAIADMKRLIAIGNNRAEGAAFASVLFLYDAFAGMRYRQKDLSPYQAPIYWLQTCKNLREILREAVELDKPDSIINAAVWSSALMEEPCVLFCEANRSKFPYLREIRSDEGLGEADYESCLTVLSCVGALKCALDMGINVQVLCRKLMDLPALFPSHFIGLLEGASLVLSLY